MPGSSGYRKNLLTVGREQSIVPASAKPTSSATDDSDSLDWTWTWYNETLSNDKHLRKGCRQQSDTRTNTLACGWDFPLSRNETLKTGDFLLGDRFIRKSKDMKDWEDILGVYVHTRRADKTSINLQLWRLSMY